ncbi:hypothetical protein RFI_35681 [Reticulomyxa filosa]|uniref:Uncharacterized protein n=1 Tax=Reticulomyxa filosa TaxID=46433 RepID=X6LKU6_RETFI|nr:hypothetical protein RFI_35681 [Reticulomyxa filosa]|eukprot:ETO01757.1 hypothetical protein RFI_35681 [Reticulomyxa filosa]
MQIDPTHIITSLKEVVFEGDDIIEHTFETVLRTIVSKKNFDIIIIKSIECQTTPNESVEEIHQLNTLDSTKENEKKILEDDKSIATTEITEKQMETVLNPTSFESKENEENNQEMEEMPKLNQDIQPNNKRSRTTNDQSVQTVLLGIDLQLSEYGKQKLIFEGLIEIKQPTKSKKFSKANKSFLSGGRDIILSRPDASLHLQTLNQTSDEKAITLDGLTKLLKDKGLLNNLSLLPEITKAFHKSSFNDNTPNSLVFDEFLQCVLRLANEMLSRKKKEQYPTQESRVALLFEQLCVVSPLSKISSPPHIKDIISPKRYNNNNNNNMINNSQIPFNRQMNDVSQIRTIFANSAEIATSSSSSRVSHPIKNIEKINNYQDLINQTRNKKQDHHETISAKNNITPAKKLMTTIQKDPSIILPSADHETYTAGHYNSYLEAYIAQQTAQENLNKRQIDYEHTNGNHANQQIISMPFDTNNRYVNNENQRSMGEIVHNDPHAFEYVHPYGNTYASPPRSSVSHFNPHQTPQTIASAPSPGYANFNMQNLEPRPYYGIPANQFNHINPLLFNGDAENYKSPLRALSNEEQQVLARIQQQQYTTLAHVTQQGNHPMYNSTTVQKKRNN